MKKLMKGILVTMLLNSPSQAEMMSAKTMKEVKAKVEEVLKTQQPQDVLVAFDIDMTLTQPDDPAVYYPALKKYTAIYKKILEELTPEQKDLALTLTTQVVPQKLVEKETPKIIKFLQQTGVKTMVLTSSLAGTINGFPDKMIILRRNQLQKMGIDFAKSFKDFSIVITFFDFKPYAGGHPMFYHGVLSTNGEGEASKGKTLIAFLQHIGVRYENKVQKPGYHPKVVFLIDDKAKHLKDVEAALKSFDPSIKFIGIEYEGTCEYAPQKISQEEFQKFWEDLARRSIFNFEN